MADVYLSRLRDLFKKQDIPFKLREKAIDSKLDILFVPFEGTDLGLSITSIPPEMLSPQGVQIEVSMLQFHVALPFDIEKPRQAVVSEFIHQLNLAVPIPGWILDRNNEAIHYRYVQVNGRNPATDEETTYIMQVIAFYMTNYVPILSSLIQGKDRLESALQKMQAITQPAKRSNE